MNPDRRRARCTAYASVTPRNASRPGRRYAAAPASPALNTGVGAVEEPLEPAPVLEGALAASAKHISKDASIGSDATLGFYFFQAAQPRGCGIYKVARGREG
jgi:hypothetical protein